MYLYYTPFRGMERKVKKTYHLSERWKRFQKNKTPTKCLP